jgi:hypothetical protein
MIAGNQNGCQLTGDTGAQRLQALLLRRSQGEDTFASFWNVLRRRRILLSAAGTRGQRSQEGNRQRRRLRLGCGTMTRSPVERVLGQDRRIVEGSRSHQRSSPWLSVNP